MDKKIHIKQKAFKDRNISALESHKREGGKFQTPFNSIMELNFSSWRDQCIPNILWACVLAANLPREKYLSLFRLILVSIKNSVDNPDKIHITHNHLALQGEVAFRRMFSALIEDKELSSLMSNLNLIDSLPDQALWKAHFTSPVPESGWDILGQSVLACSDHQSEICTDIRWLKLVSDMMLGRMIFSADMSERVEELRLYPNKGDMNSVRPFIRASEIAGRAAEFGHEKLEAPPTRHEEFWAECYGKTLCIYALKGLDKEDEPRDLFEEAVRISESLGDHFDATIDNTNIDPRHDGAFGLVLYAISLLIEISIARNAKMTSGRLLLRSIVEVFITFKYLCVKDNPTIWTQYRNYGNGQTKLAFLKNVREETVPDFIDLHELEALANADVWVEFQDIKIGAWANLSLRQMAIEANCKDVYDKYYDILSGFTHGHWGAVRDTAFTQCFNPLHRWHRVPGPAWPKTTVSADACKLVNRMLDDLNHLYPPYKLRIRSYKEKKTE